MKSMNRVTLIGNAAADAEIKSTQEGALCAHISIATDTVWKNKEGQQQKRTDFHRVTFWNKLAEVCEKFVKKGTPLFLEGSLKNSSYTNAQGEKKYSTDIIGNDLTVLRFASN